jgi:SAM-dependent methyltransferase
MVAALDADGEMLAVARASRVSADEAAIECHHASALTMPFRDNAFDYVLCLEGIQFFPDRVAGLREMRRVLRPGGTLVATVWGPIEQNPAYHAISEGLRRFVSADAARLPPFTLSDAETIRTLVSGAGFVAVTVSLASERLTVPSADAFVAWVAAGGPTIRHNLALLSVDRRQGFDDFVAARLAPYRTEQSLVLPSTRNIVIAH